MIEIRSASTYTSNFFLLLKCPAVRLIVIRTLNLVQYANQIAFSTDVAVLLETHFYSTMLLTSSENMQLIKNIIQKTSI